MARILLVRHGRSALVHDGSVQIIAASDMTRAIASEQRLAPQRELAISPLLREIELEPPRWVPFRLPIEMWDVFSHLQWSYRLMADVDHQFTRRAHQAVDWLMAHAAGSSTVLAVTHGGFRRLLDARLLARGWARTPERKSYANWSTWKYSR